MQAWVGNEEFETMTAAELGPYRVEAFNTAKAWENKIHDDAVARRGFRREDRALLQSRPR